MGDTVAWVVYIGYLGTLLESGQLHITSLDESMSCPYFVTMSYPEAFH
jgi:hypothetical protein